jgi:hypothetical protein
MPERPPLVGEISANLAPRGYNVISVMDPHGRILDILDRGYLSAIFKLSIVALCYTETARIIPSQS